MEEIWGGGVSKCSVESFLSRSTETKHFVEERISAVFQKTFGRERVYGKEGGRGGLSKISVEKILSQNAEKLRRGIF